jgi:hypothetical protein
MQDRTSDEVTRLQGFICRARVLRTIAPTQHARMRAARLEMAADRRLTALAGDATPYDDGVWYVATRGQRGR